MRAEDAGQRKIDGEDEFDDIGNARRSNYVTYKL